MKRNWEAYRKVREWKSPRGPGNENGKNDVVARNSGSVGGGCGATEARVPSRIAVNPYRVNNSVHSSAHPLSITPPSRRAESKRRVRWGCSTSRRSARSNLLLVLSLRLLLRRYLFLPPSRDECAERWRKPVERKEKRLSQDNRKTKSKKK